MVARQREIPVPRPGDGPPASTRWLALAVLCVRPDVIIAAYQAFLDKVRGRDDVSFAPVVGLLAAQTHRRADAQAALAGQ